VPCLFGSFYILRTSLYKSWIEIREKPPKVKFILLESPHAPALMETKIRKEVF
jgi:hypothetical protein